MKTIKAKEVFNSDDNEKLLSDGMMHKNFFLKNTCCGKCKGKGPCFSDGNKLSSIKIKHK